MRGQGGLVGGVGLRTGVEVSGSGAGAGGDRAGLDGRLVVGPVGCWRVFHANGLIAVTAVGSLVELPLGEFGVKNIVICCDGTMAQYGARDENSNVVRLFERLRPDGQGQISYHDLGVGTYSPARTRVGHGWVKSPSALTAGAADD